MTSLLYVLLSPRFTITLTAEQNSRENCMTESCLKDYYNTHVVENHVFIFGPFVVGLVEG